MQADIYHLSEWISVCVRKRRKKNEKKYSQNINGFNASIKCEVDLNLVCYINVSVVLFAFSLNSDFDFGLIFFLFMFHKR